jgi:erythromycin esterase
MALMITRRQRLHRTLLLLLSVGSLLAMDVSAASSAAPPDGAGRVRDWIEHHHQELQTVDPLDPLHDLGPLRHVTGDASVVGLGESTHGSHEHFQVKHRMVRYLVERLGFRTLALEDDFGSGVLLDRYVTTGEGNPRELAMRMSSPFWATEEIVVLLDWLRSYNQTHDDKVHILGADLLWLRRVSFDTITGYVDQVAPERLDELEALVEPVKLQGEEWEQFDWYDRHGPDEREGLIAAAGRLEPFIAGLPRSHDPLAREHALQHARAIAGWYANYARTTGFRDHRERFIADTITWWRDVNGGRVIYWAANVHTAAAPELTYRTRTQAVTGTMAGGLLRAQLGDDYVSIGTWFHHGAISSNYDDPSTHRVARPASDLLEATLGAIDTGSYIIDVPDHGAPLAVRDWLRRPSTMRVILPSYREPEDSSDYNMSVPTLGDSFDAFVFVRETTPSRLLAR